MAKKTEIVTKETTKEQPKEEVVMVKEEQETPNSKLQEIAIKLGMDNASSADTTALIDFIYDSLIEIEEKLKKLSSMMDSDERLSGVIKRLFSGETIDEVFESLEIKSKHKPLDDQNPEFTKALSEASIFCERHKINHSEIDCFRLYIEEMLNTIAAGEFNSEIFESLWKAYMFDTEVHKAYQAGEIAGRNTQIETIREEKNGADELSNIKAGRNTERKTKKQGYIEGLMSYNR